MEIYHKNNLYGHSSPSADSRRAVVSFWRKYAHQVLVNRLERLSLPRNSVVRLNDRHFMTEILLLQCKMPTQTNKSWLVLTQITESIVVLIVSSSLSEASLRSTHRINKFTLQETWLEFLWCRERIQWKSGMPRIGVGGCWDKNQWKRAKILVR